MSRPILVRMGEWIHGLSLDDVPPRVREHAKNQVLSTLAAVLSGYESDLGPRLERLFPVTGGPARVIPTGESATPMEAVLRMASWSMVLDFDDVMLGGHTGHSSVLVPWAYAHALEVSGADLLTAQVAANEVAARINMVCAVGETRGQMATHLHLLGAAAARAKLEGASAETVSRALAFALSYPAKALFPAFLGSDAKALCAAWPIRMGLESLDAVRAGLEPHLEILEDSRGFFATHARIPVHGFLEGLGRQWHTETNSYKVHPSCGYLSSTLDAVLALVRRHDLSASDVTEVDVHGSIFTVGMDAHSAPYLRGPDSRISTVTFSTPYTVAWAILDRELAPRHFSREALSDPRAWELAGRVRVHHDLELTYRALTGDIPLGAALLRTRPRQAAGFVLALGKKAFGTAGMIRRFPRLLVLALRVARAARRAGPLDLERMTKPLGTRVRIHTRDGRMLEEAREIPEGYAGAESWESARDKMHRKLVDAATPWLGESGAQSMAEQIARLEHLDSGELRELFDPFTTPSLQGRGLRAEA